MKVLHYGDDLVLPFAPKGGPFHFATLRTHGHRGHVAGVREVDTSPRKLARQELPEGAEPELVEHTAAFVLGELAWLHRVPDGAEVVINTRGVMTCRVSPQHLDYHREEARQWAKKLRRAGYLPVLVVQGDRVRTVALPWREARAAVDLDVVRRCLPQFGIASADHVEVL